MTTVDISCKIPPSIRNSAFTLLFNHSFLDPKKISIEDVHVVVVDDNEAERQNTVDQLKAIGFQDIDVAAEGEEGLARIAERTRLLIANVHMPHMNGIELLRVIREAQNFERREAVEIASSRKNLKLVLEARDSNSAFGTVRMIKHAEPLSAEDGLVENEPLEWDDDKKTNEWDISGEWEVPDHWQDPEEDQRYENVVQIPHNLAVLMVARKFQPDALGKILNFGGAEFMRKPLNQDELSFIVHKALMEASAEEGIREKYGRWAESLEFSGRELIYEFGMEKKSFKETFPYQDRHPNPLDEFCTDGNISIDAQPFLNSNPNWTTDRRAADISARWKIVFASLVLANFKYCRSLYARENNIDDEEKITDKILVCDLGLGSGKTLRGLRQKGIPEDSLAGVATTRLFELQSMLESALLPETKQDEDSALNRFLKYFSVEFLNQKGMGGLLTIQAGVPESETRLRKMLLEVDVEDICDEKKLLLPLMFSEEREETVPDEAVELFKEYRQDPRAFFRNYFKPALIDASQGNLKDFAQTHGKHVLPLDFRNMGERLSEAQLLGPTYDCRALSHIPDPGYYNTMTGVLARLIPGAIHIGDGSIQSYSGHIRGGELMEILEEYEKKGNPGEYKAWWLGDDEGPLASVVQRGVYNKRAKRYQFWDSEKDEQYRFETYLRGAEMVPLGQFYKRWPKLALKNLVIRELRKRFWDEAMKDIVSGKESVQYVRTWLSKLMRIPAQCAERMEEWDKPASQGVWIKDYLDVFLTDVFESEDFQKYAAEDASEKLEQWMKRRMNNKKSGWIVKLADRFMERREEIKSQIIAEKQMPADEFESPKITEGMQDEETEEGEHEKAQSS